jgi:hypothetical protein
VSDEQAAEPAVVEEARAALEAGAPWRARDLLAAHVETERDPEALALLAQVHHDMGDLPRAGAIWFAAGAKGPDVDAAVAAWREQAHDDFGVMWHALPASVRAQPRPRRIEALRERARAVETDDEERGDPASTADEDDDDGGFEGAWLVAWVLAIAFVVFAVIGFITALTWVVPG